MAPDLTVSQLLLAWLGHLHRIAPVRGTSGERRSRRQARSVAGPWTNKHLSTALVREYAIAQIPRISSKGARTREQPSELLLSYYSNDLIIYGNGASRQAGHPQNAAKTA